MFHVHRFDIERFKLVTDPEDYRKVYLVSEGYQPSWPHPLAAYEEWFASHLEDVARSCSEDPLELAKQFTDPDPRVRAQAYRDVGGYHGFDNFDSYPLELTETQLDARWGR